MPKRQAEPHPAYRLAGRLLPAVLLAVNVPAATVTGEVRNQNGEPVMDAVVVATPLDGEWPQPAGERILQVLDQHGREFVPHVLVVARGSWVSFPNHDQIRHHVYSFSPAKRFEIKLYKDILPEPVHFDTPGIAVLGCNIHDWMIGYVYVSASPYFSKTDSSGRWTLQLPAATFNLTVWHPDLPAGDDPAPTAQSLGEGRTTRVETTLRLRTGMRTGKPPASLQDEGYRDEP